MEKLTESRDVENGFNPLPSPPNIRRVRGERRTAARLSYYNTVDDDSAGCSIRNVRGSGVSRTNYGIDILVERQNY